MPDLGYLAALLGGVLALLSPCSALLLPSFFAYAFVGRTALLARTAVFGLGMAAVLVPLGAGSSALASLVTVHRAALVTAAGVVVIVLGVVQILGGGWVVASAARVQQRAATAAGGTPSPGASGSAGSSGTRLGSWAATAVLGGVYGLAGFCSGPILGSVLTVAAAGGAPLRGAALLGVYALGMTVPLFVLALVWERLDLGRRSWLRGREFRVGPLRLHTTSTVSGLLFVAIGVVFVVFDGTASLVGLSPESSAAAEETASGLGRAVPDVALLGGLALLVVAVVAVRLARTREHR